MTRAYTPDDMPAIQRIWKEVGWIDSDEEAAQLEHFFTDGNVLVGEVNDEVECSVTTHTGSYSYDGADLDLLLVSSVTTSWIGRKQGLAGRLTAEAVVAGAEAGAEMAILGMFEQGFYDRLGFGSGTYEHIARFDPSSIRVDAKFRAPVRLGPDDAEEVAESMRRRARSHGGVVVDSPGWFRADLAWTTPAFALGYRSESGQLTHFVIGKAKGESGPYKVYVMCYETVDQLLELFAMLHGLGDQVRSVEMQEPPHIQVQDVLIHPVRSRIVTKGTEFESGTRAIAWWQVRILDVAAAVSKRRWIGEPVKFNLELRDPLDDYPTGDWQTTSGTYIVEIGEESTAVRGEQASVPTLRASVNAFSRMWIGALPATALAHVDDLEGPAELLEALDEALLLPTPRPGMYF